MNAAVESIKKRTKAIDAKLKRIRSYADNVIQQAEDYKKEIKKLENEREELQEMIKPYVVAEEL